MVPRPAGCTFGLNPQQLLKVVSDPRIPPVRLGKFARSKHSYPPQAVVEVAGVFGKPVPTKVATFLEWFPDKWLFGNERGGP